MSLNTFRLLFLTFVLLTFSNPLLFDPSNLKYAKNVDMREFQETLKQIMIPRVPSTYGSSVVQNVLYQKMAQNGFRVFSQKFQKYAPTYGGSYLYPVGFTNVIAKKGPRNRKKFILACHYDTLNMESFVGAVDSAVPCSMITTISKFLSDSLPDHKMKYELMTVFFDGEEAFDTWSESDSLYGSKYLANYMSERNKIRNIEVFMLLDLIGTQGTHFKKYAEATSDLFTKLNQIETHLHKMGLLKNHRNGQYFGDEMLQSIGIEDDHIPFQRRGVKILHLITTPFPQCWHKLCDNEQSLDIPTIENLMKIFAVFLIDSLSN